MSDQLPAQPTAALRVSRGHCECASCGFGRGGWASVATRADLEPLHPGSRRCPQCEALFTHLEDPYAGTVTEIAAATTEPAPRRRNARESELSGMLIQACHKLHEPSGAVAELGRPDYAQEFTELARELRTRMFEMEEEPLPAMSDR